MKLTDLKHDHSLTNLLKVIIFSILMLTPFFYVATKCLYVVCNKNAYESYSGTNQNTQSNINVNTINNFDYSKTYYLTNSQLTTAPTNAIATGTIYFNNVEVITGNASYENFERLYFYVGANSTSIVYNFDGGNTPLSSSTNFLLKVNIRSIVTTTDTQITNFNYIFTNSSALYYIDYFTDQQLDNVFEYSVNQMAQSQLFTWTQNTGVYTGANAMTTGLGLTSPVIPILISYWFLLTIIYVVIDIVIVCFTTITHMIVKKSN